LVSYCNSDWAGDAETRIIVTGFIIYLLGVPICWRSKGQKGDTLSSSKAEYVVISEAVKEIQFIYYLLESIGMNVKLSIVVRCNNVGAFLWPRIQALEFAQSTLTLDTTLFANILRMVSFKLCL
jgi:hypothetical protein